MHVIQAVSLRWYNACAYYAVSLGSALVRNGVRSTVIGSADTPAVVRAHEAGADVYALPGNPRRNPLDFVAQARACRRFVDENPADIVDVHTGNDHLVWAWALRGTGIPLVRTSGNQIPPNAHPGARWLMGTAAKVIVSCRTVRRYYIDRFGYDTTDIPVINGGIDTAPYAGPFDCEAVRAQLGFDGSHTVYGMFARFSPDKGHEYFFDAAGRTARECPSARFLVAGWKAQRTVDDIRRMAAQAGVLDRSVFLGKEPDIRSFIAACDAGVIASVASETICRIGMEYMATGVPVVATDTNVVPEVVRDGETGIVVPARDGAAMGEAMIRLYGSPEQRRRMGEAGRMMAEREYSLDAFGRATLRAYESVVHQ